MKQADVMFITKVMSRHNELLVPTRRHDFLSSYLQENVSKFSSSQVESHRRVIITVTRNTKPLSLRHCSVRAQKITIPVQRLWDWAPSHLSPVVPRGSFRVYSRGCSGLRARYDEMSGKRVCESDTYFFKQKIRDSFCCHLHDSYKRWVTDCLGASFDTISCVYGSEDIEYTRKTTA